MTLDFDIEKLHSLLEDFYNLTKIRITVFDDEFNELTSYPEQIAPFCQIIRTDANGAKECKRCDSKACEMAKNRRTAYTYRCHAGLTESIAPLTLGNITIGYLLFGHVFSYESYTAGWETISKSCAKYEVDMNELKAACFDQPRIEQDFIDSATQIMQAVASYLCLEKMVSLKKRELPAQIEEYISLYYCEPITVDDLCTRFHVGKTKFYQICKDTFGIGFAEHVRNLRLEKARDLLSSSELSVSEIAYQCGFNDYNYFITVFTKHVGVSPKQYMKKQQSKNKK